MVKIFNHQVLLKVVLMALTFGMTITGISQSISSSYTAGDIPTNNSGFSSSCNGPLTTLALTLPAGPSWDVVGVDISYTMTANSGAWKGEQRSLVYCQNTTTEENGGTYYSGSGSTGGTQGYNRNGVSIANGIYAGGATLTFEMRAYRTWTGGGTCNTTYNKVDDGTWTITVHYVAPPTCPAPSLFSASIIGSNDVTLDWTENGTASLWDIEYGTSGFSPSGTPTIENISSKPYLLSGLSSITDYDFYVRSDCGGGDESTWIGPLSLTTLESCPSPSSLGSTNVLYNQADLSWTENGSATQWDIELGLNGFTPSGTPTQSISTNPYTYSGLIPNTAYQYYVRANCGSGDESYWVGPYSFSTPILTGQVFVSASAGLSNAVYASVKLAFDKINDGTHQGDITILIGDANGQTITETAEAVLNKSGIGSASYTSVNIQPGAANIKVVGSLNGSCCVASGIIKLNQAENVIVDGRQGGTGSAIDLTIENTNTGSYASAFVFFAASNNSLKYTNVKSSVVGTSSGSGTIGITDNNLGGGKGSSNNSVEYCTVSPSGSNRPRKAIWGKGASGRENSNNLIRGNTIYGFSEYGIFLGSSSSTEGYNRSWIIEDNVIYQPDAINLNSNQIGICVGNPFSSSAAEQGTFIIQNNTIGTDGGSGDWVSTATSSSYRVAGIAVNTTSSAYTEINGNTIKNFDVQLRSTATDYGLFSGIVVSNGKTAIGNTEGNTIGSLTDASNIKVGRNNTTNGGFVSGIHVRTSSDLSTKINNNTVAGFDLTAGQSDLFFFYGIRNSSSTTYPTDSVYKNNVSYNQMEKVNYFHGIFGNGYMAKNRVRDIDFTGAASFSILKGISWYGGELTGSDARGVENNEIILGKTKAGNATAINDEIVGIEITRGDADVYHNSVLIEGTHTGSETTKAYLINWSGTINFINNLAYNERTGGTGNHYGVVKVSNGVAFNSSNNAYVIGTSANNLVGSNSGVNQATLANWQAATGETNSIFDTNINQPTSILFPFIGMDSLDVTDPSWLESGTPIVVYDDIADRSRDLVVPTIGAYEKFIIVLLPIELIEFTGENKDTYNEIRWITNTEINNDKFVVEKSRDGINWTPLGEVKGAGNSSLPISYRMDDNNPYTLTYYRLKQFDFNGKMTPSKIIAINNEGTNTGLNWNVYPNPATTHLSFTIANIEDETPVKVTIYNALGQLMYSETLNIFNHQAYTLDLFTFSAGMYTIKIYVPDHLTEMKKFTITKP